MSTNIGALLVTSRMYQKVIGSRILIDPNDNGLEMSFYQNTVPRIWRFVQNKNLIMIVVTKCPQPSQCQCQHTTTRFYVDQSILYHEIEINRLQFRFQFSTLKSLVPFHLERKITMPEWNVVYCEKCHFMADSMSSLFPSPTCFHPMRPCELRRMPGTFLLSRKAHYSRCSSQSCSNGSHPE